MAELLDLNQHSAEDFAGKAVELNGATYTLGDLIAEGGEALVHPMVNVRSGLDQFVAKVYKFKRGSSELQEREKRLGYDSFLLQMNEVPALYTEIHEVPGGLFRLQDNLARAVSRDAYRVEQMKEASSHANAMRWQAAADIYTDVLARNPSHTDALRNIATCQLRMGDSGQALATLQQALRVEPNDAEAYRTIARVFAELHVPLGALHFLDATLARYYWDAPTWKLKTDLAARFGLHTVVDAMLSELAAIGPPHSTMLEPVKTKWEQLSRTARDGASIRGAAVSQQVSNDWVGAAQLWDRVGEQQLDADELVNYAMSLYRVGRYEQASELALRALHASAPGPVTTRFAAAVTALVASIACERNEHALSYARLLVSQASDPMDLPALPTALLEGGAVMEERSGNEVVDRLRALQSRMHPRTEALPTLIDLYVRRESHMVRRDPDAL